MCRNFNAKEMKEVIFSIPNIKSSGPNGYSSGFLKSTWHLIGPMVCTATQDFFITGQMPKSICATKLVVLPKVIHLQTASDPRPIFYCNVIYKCISKLLG